MQKKENTHPQEGDTSKAQVETQKALKGKGATHAAGGKKVSSKAKAGKQTKSTSRNSSKGNRLKALKKTPEERALTLYAQGQTYEEIAEAEHITEQEAVNIVRNAEEKAETLRAIAMQSYIKANHLDTRGRVETLRNLRDKLIGALDRVNLAEAAPDKLVALLLKTQTLIKEEVGDAPSMILSEQEQLMQAKERAIAQLTQ